MDDAITRRRGGQFTIGHLMAAIAVAGVWLALPVALRWILAVMAIPGCAMAAARRLEERGLCHRAGWAFGIAAGFVNLVVVVACVEPGAAVFELTLLLLVVVATPTVGSFALAWLRMLEKDMSASGKRRRCDTALFVALLAVALPFVTFWTLWPLRAAFRLAEPALDRLANQVASGGPVTFPRHVGVFSIEVPVIDPMRGYVGLKTTRACWLCPGFGPTDIGFVRVQPGSTRTTHGPFVGVHFDVHLGGGWWYRG